MRIEDIENREFSFCSGSDMSTEKRVWRQWIVPSPSKPVAAKQAAAYANSRGWEIEKIHIYPRTYVKDARALFHAGEYPGGR